MESLIVAHSTNLLARNELLRTHAVCKLYFDLDGGPEHLPGDDIVRDLLLEVCERLQEVYKLHVEASDVIVLCSCSETKFSKHIIFPVEFKNNWQRKTL